MTDMTNDLDRNNSEARLPDALMLVEDNAGARRGKS